MRGHPWRSVTARPLTALQSLTRLSLNGSFAREARSARSAKPYLCMQVRWLQETV